MILKNYKNWFRIDQSQESCQIRGMGIEEQMPAGWVNRPMGTDDIMILWLNKDCAIHQQQLQQDSIVIWNRHMHHFYGHGQIAWCHSWIHLRGKVPEKLLQELQLPFGIPAQLSDNDHLSLLQLLGQELHHIQPNPNMIKALTEALIHHASRSWHVKKHIPPALVQARNMIHDSETQQLRLAEIAEAVQLSVSHCCALYRQFYGTTMGADMIQRRMELASYHLRNLSYKIGDVAEKLGYPDLYSFSKQFKIVHGKSPKQFRKDLFES